MLKIIPIIALTTFISVNGQVQEVPINSSEAIAYEVNAVTDLGDPDNLATTETETTETTETTEPSEAPEPIVQIINDNSEEVALLSEAVELLAENSTTVTGTVNSSVLDLMDRMVDSYPDYYKYAGFRTSTDDSYQTTLYIAKRATVNGSTIIFSEDCVSVNFARYQQSGYTGYVYYEVVDSPGASVDVNSNSIVYTNVLDSYPALGNKSQIDSSYIWIMLLIGAVLIIFTRRNKQ